MSLVNITVQSDEAQPQPIVGATVTIVTTTSPIEVMARDISDENGLVGWDLPDSTYEVRAFKRGVIFSRTGIVVSGDGAYTLSGTLMTLPVATDPRLCRCTGRFVSHSNTPLADLMVEIRPADESGFEVPKIVDGNMTVSRSTYLPTDENGLLTIDLFRTGEYNVVFSGNDDRVWAFKVPDRPSANLIDLIHPQPVSLTWDSTVAPGNAVSVPAGRSVAIPITVFFSDFETISEGVESWLELSSSDVTVATARFFQGSVVVSGVDIGAATITATAREGIFPRRVPTYSVSLTPLAVAVQ